MSDVNWNYFRYAADYLHFGGMALGLAVATFTRSVDGFSGKTQVLYQIVYISRYLDVFTDVQTTYLLFFKMMFNVVTAVMIGLFALFRHTYDSPADSCNILLMVGPALFAAHMASKGAGFKEEMWTFSEFLEPVALLPQYIICYRSQRVRLAVVMYVFCLGGYRFLYVCNWIYKRYKWASAYHDYVSWTGGIVECILFIDWVFRIIRRQEVIEASLIGRAMLSMDDKAGRISETVELGTLGRRLPFGLSGTGGSANQENALGGGAWEISDKKMEEESCGLLTLDGDVDEL